MNGVGASSVLASSVAVAVAAAAPQAPTTVVVAEGALYESELLRILVQGNADVVVVNKDTAERYRLGCDGRVEVDEAEAFRFYGSTSFSFDDGTHLTLSAAVGDCDLDPAAAGPRVVTITRDDYGVQIMAAGGDGPLSIDERPRGGVALDAAVADGNVLLDNALGSGFVALDRDGTLHVVNQAWIDGSDVLKLRELEVLLRRLFRLFQALLRISLMTNVWLSISQIDTRMHRPEDERPRPKPRPVPEAWHGAHELQLAYDPVDDRYEIADRPRAPRVVTRWVG